MKYILKIVLTTAFVLANALTFACEVCEKQQPKILRGVTHGAGPQSDWDYVIVGVTVLIVLASLVYAVKWIANPGEKASEHIKRTILDFD